MSRPADGKEVLRIWSEAVDATHHFLSVDDKIAIGREVAAFLPEAPLLLAVDEANRILGFMALTADNIDALFVDPAHHGMGVGRHLVGHAAARHATLTVDVNEQNERALGFYDRMGFFVIGRSRVDGQGRAYPLLHLRRPVIL